VENPVVIVALDTKRPERLALSAILFPARLRLAEVPERDLSTTKRLEEL